MSRRNVQKIPTCITERFHNNSKEAFTIAIQSPHTLMYGIVCITRPSPAVTPPRIRLCAIAQSPLLIVSKHPSSFRHSFAHLGSKYKNTKGAKKMQDLSEAQDSRAYLLSFVHLFMSQRWAKSRTPFSKL
jgi:hypothetical protein